DLLAHLASHPGQVFTREQLLVQVWGYHDGSGARTVDSHVRAVRRKLGPDVIRTVHGVGYAADDAALTAASGGPGDRSRARAARSTRSRLSRSSSAPSSSPPSR